MEVDEVINVVKTAHEFLVAQVGTPTEDDTLLPAQSSTTGRVERIQKMYWFLWTTTVSVKDLYSRFRLWNKISTASRLAMWKTMAQFFDTSSRLILKPVPTSDREVSMVPLEPLPNPDDDSRMQKFV
jgi:hypothetical protein